MPPAKLSTNFNHSNLLDVSSIFKPLKSSINPAKVHTAAATKRSARLGTAGFNREKFFTNDILVPNLYNLSFSALSQIQRISINDANEKKSCEIFHIRIKLFSYLDVKQSKFSLDRLSKAEPFRWCQSSEGFLLFHQFYYFNYLICILNYFTKNSYHLKQLRGSSVHFLRNRIQ